MGETRCDGWDGRLIVTCAFETREATETATGWLITQRSRIRILSSLPAETRPEGFAPGGCHAAREHGSTCQLSALPHGAAARTTVCMFGFLKPSDRSSGLRSFGLSEADHSGSLSGSRPMQQRLVCVEAGQTFSIQRMEVLTPQVSSIHCRLTRSYRRCCARRRAPLPRVRAPEQTTLRTTSLASAHRAIRAGRLSISRFQIIGASCRRMSPAP